MLIDSVAELRANQVPRIYTLPNIRQYAYRYKANIQAPSYSYNLTVISQSVPLRDRLSLFSQTIPCTPPRPFRLTQLLELPPSASDPSRHLRRHVAEAQCLRRHLRHGFEETEIRVATRPRFGRAAGRNDSRSDRGGCFPRLGRRSGAFSHPNSAPFCPLRHPAVHCFGAGA